MKKEELNEYGYPINKDSDKKIRQGMDFGTWVGFILILIMIIWWVLKLVGIIRLQRIKIRDLNYSVI
jgi:hypothetical protein